MGIKRKLKYCNTNESIIYPYICTRKLCTANLEEHRAAISKSNIFAKFQLEKSNQNNCINYEKLDYIFQGFTA